MQVVSTVVLVNTRMKQVNRHVKHLFGVIIQQIVKGMAIQNAMVKNGQKLDIVAIQIIANLVIILMDWLGLEGTQALQIFTHIP